MIGVLGVGRWGSNYVKALKEMQIPFKTCDINDAFDKFLESVEKVIICTPSSTHYKLAKKCLIEEKDVMIEKPATFSVEEFGNLVKLAIEKKRVLYPALLMEHHEAIKKLEKLAPLPDHVEMRRVQFNKNPNRDTPILWNLALHDIDVCLYLWGMPSSYKANQEKNEGYIVLWYPTFSVFIWVSYNKKKTVRMNLYHKRSIQFDDVAKTLKIGQITEMVEELPLNNLIKCFVNQTELNLNLIKRAKSVIQILEETCKM